jgi:hypothetical protein
MRKTALLSVVGAFLAAAVFATTASASTTYHGEFTSATGMHKTLLGTQTIGVRGTWNVSVDPQDPQDTQITGHALVYHFHTDMVPLTGSSPTGGLHNATWLVTWTDITWSHGVLTAHGTATIQTYMPGKSVGLTFTLDPTATVPVKLHVDLSTHYVSEAGWLSWDITGDLRP